MKSYMYVAGYAIIAEWAMTLLHDYKKTDTATLIGYFVVPGAFR